MTVKQRGSRDYRLLMPTGCKSRCLNHMRPLLAVSACPMLRSYRRKKSSALELNSDVSLSVQGPFVLSIGCRERGSLWRRTRHTTRDDLSLTAYTIASCPTTRVSCLSSSKALSRRLILPVKKAHP